MLEKQSTNGNTKAEAVRTATNRAIATQSNANIFTSIFMSTGLMQKGQVR